MSAYETKKIIPNLVLQAGLELYPSPNQPHVKPFFNLASSKEECSLEDCKQAEHEDEDELIEDIKMKSQLKDNQTIQYCKRNRKPVEVSSLHLIPQLHHIASSLPAPYQPVKPLLAPSLHWGGNEEGVASNTKRKDVMECAAPEEDAFNKQFIHINNGQIW